ncbi:MAG TPA: YceI family protein [Thermoanaerobaculia bacterium]|jgi:polyisoprenoid-binding protein YceI
MLRRRAVPLFLVVSSLAAPLAAETLTFELDPAATRIEFTFGATLHTVNGSLRARQGTVQVDTGSGAASGWIVLDATSAQTGNSRRDRKMHEKILESRRFPDIVFDVQRVSGRLNRVGRSELQVHGTLDFHGDRRPFALPVVAATEGDQVTATGTVTVPYVEWGLRDPSFFLLRVEKEVRVTVKAAGRLTG